MRGLGGVSIRVPHSSLAIVAKLSNSNGSSLTFSAVFTRNRHHCVRAFSTCTHGFLNGVRHPSMSGVANLDPIVDVRRGAAGGGPHSAINAAARVCSCLHLLFTHTNATCDCHDNRRVIGCARRRIVSVVLSRCTKGTVFLLTPLVHRHGKRCHRLFRDVHHGNCLCMHISKRVRRIMDKVGLSHCGVRGVRIIVSGLIIGRSSRRHVHGDMTATVGRNSNVIVIVRGKRGAKGGFSGHLVSPIANVTCRSPTPGVFSFGSPRNTYPRYGNLKGMGRVSVGGIVPSSDRDVCRNKVTPLNGCGGRVVF